MLTYVLPGTPRPLSSDSPECQWLWTAPDGKGPPAPWGGPSQRVAKPVHWVPDGGVPTDCFTVELWLRPDQPLASVEHPLVNAACNQRGTAWWCGLTRHLRPALRWRDRQGQEQELLADSLVDLLAPAQWLHVAIVHHGQGADPAEVTHEYTRWSLYVTPAGEAWPRLAAHEGSGRCAMPAASGCVALEPGAFAFAQAACSKHAKLPCEFPTLGQDAPEGVTFAAGFPGGSARSPVGLGPRRVAVACSPGVTDANYWFHSRVTVADPGDHTPLDLTLLAAPRGQAMLNTLFRSRDGERWERLPGGWFMTDRSHSAQGFLRVRVPVEDGDFYLAAAPPYSLADRDRLLADLQGNPLATPLELGSSTRGRPIRGLCLTDPAVPAEKKSFVYLQAGQHSPLEQATGIVLDRLARTVTADPRYAGLLRSHELHLVPLVNADTADLGEAGLTQLRLNPNRYWLGRSIPETAGIRAHLDGLARRPGRMRLALDLHAGGTWPHHTVLYLGRTRAETLCPPGWGLELARWLELLEAHTGIAREDALETTEDVVHFSVAVAVRYGWPAATLEFSLFTERSLDGLVQPVTQASFEACGERLAAALAVFCSA